MLQFTREELRSKKVFCWKFAGAAIKGLLQLKDHFKPEDVVVVLFHDSGSRREKCLMMTGCANVVFLKKKLKAEDVIKDHIDKPLSSAQAA
jgi:cystathionine beta-synthase